MSAAKDIQDAVSRFLAQPGNLRVEVRVVSRVSHDRQNDIEAALANHGLCIYVMRPLPTQVERVPDFVFVSDSDLRVHVMETVAKNRTGADAYDIMDDVMCGLQGVQFAPLSHPLVLRPHPCDFGDDKQHREIVVHFSAIYGFRRAAGTFDSTRGTFDDTATTFDQAEA